MEFLHFVHVCSEQFVLQAMLILPEISNIIPSKSKLCTVLKVALDKFPVSYLVLPLTISKFMMIYFSYIPQNPQWSMQFKIQDAVPCQYSGRGANGEGRVAGGAEQILCSIVTLDYIPDSEVAVVRGSEMDYFWLMDLMGFPDDSEVKNSPGMQETQETWVHFLGRKDLLEEDLANPLQQSCQENPMDGGTWQATVHGVAESDMTEATEPNDCNIYRFGHQTLLRSLK